MGQLWKTRKRRTKSRSELILHILQQRLDGLVTRERAQLDAFFHVWLLEGNLYVPKNTDTSTQVIRCQHGRYRKNLEVADLRDLLELLEGFPKACEVKNLHSQ